MMPIFEKMGQADTTRFLYIGRQPNSSVVYGSVEAKCDWLERMADEPGCWKKKLVLPGGDGDGDVDEEQTQIASTSAPNASLFRPAGRSISSSWKNLVAKLKIR